MYTLLAVTAAISTSLLVAAVASLLATVALVKKLLLIFDSLKSFYNTSVRVDLHNLTSHRFPSISTHRVFAKLEATASSLKVQKAKG